MKRASFWQSAFVSPRVLAGFLVAGFGVTLVLMGFASPGSSALAQEAKGENPVAFQSVASYHNDVSRPLRELALLPARASAREKDNENPKVPNHHKDELDTVVQKNLTVAKLAALTSPTPILNFAGIAYPGVNCNCHPPDTNGAIGATQYVQIVNEGYQVFNKNTGASVLGPVSITSIWTGFGGLCETSGQGDPVVLYDHFANRWVISQFAGANITDECVAVSTTNDATGTYNRYGFHLGSNSFDYPKLGVWSDAYYLSMNVFSGNSYLGPQPFALNRAAMLTGAAATFVSPVSPLGSSIDPLLPADIDGPNLPPANAPETFVRFPGGGQYVTYHFHVDFATPGNSTWTTFATPAAASFTTLCPTTSCVPTQGDSVDSLGDRLMHRLAYRNFGNHESVVGTYSVSANGVGAVRWFELRNVTAGPVTVFQESTFQPDTLYRWMGSAAMDGLGNMAIGYSVSNGSTHPQIRYNTRMAGDPLNTLNGGEVTLIAGTGSPTDGSGRWGDYSAMTVDPVDDQTFWYTTEYYTSVAGGVAWQTRIGSFRLQPVAQPTADTVALTAENFTPANGVPDPGESVTVNLAVKNTGNLSTTNLVGTLQASGGVTNPSGPQTYGALAPNGSVAKSFTFTASGACGSNITLTLALQDGATTYGNVTFTLPLGVISTTTQTFSNAASVTINDATTATPYPTSISVSGVTGTVTKVVVKLNSLNHTFPDDVDMLLVSPTGRKMIILSDAGGGNDWVNATITLADSAASALSDTASNPTGTYRPANYNTAQDPFASPAPAGPYLTPASGGTDTLASAFNGQNPNGTWSLYIVDDAGQDTGNMNGGWQLIITTSTTACVSTAAPSITNGPPSATVIVGTPYNFAFSATGNPPPTFTLSGNPVPPGLGLSSGGVLSGTATSGGTGLFPGITVTASNGVAPAASQTFSLTAVTIAPNYIASFGLTGTDAVLTFDYDGDGLANLMEYALGLDPTIAGLGGLPVVIVKDYSGTQYLSMTFVRSSLATDLTYIVQGSSDLINWSDLGTSAAGVVTTGPGFVTETGSAPSFTVEVRDTVPYSPNPATKRFLRLKVTSP